MWKKNNVSSRNKNIYKCIPIYIKYGIENKKTYIIQSSDFCLIKITKN